MNLSPQYKVLFYSLSIVDHDRVQDVLSLLQLFTPHHKDGVLRLRQAKQTPGVRQGRHPEPLGAHGVKLGEDRWTCELAMFQHKWMFLLVLPLNK